MVTPLRGISWMASSSAQICTSSTQLQRTCDEGLILRCTRLPWWRMVDCASLEKSDISDHQLAHCTVPLVQRLEPKLTFQEVAKLRTEPLTLPEWRTGGRAGSRITSRDICRTTPLDLISDKAEQAVELPDDTGRKRRATRPRSDISGPTTRIPESPHPSVVRTRLCWVRRGKVQVEHDPCQQLIHRYEMSVKELSNRFQNWANCLWGHRAGSTLILPLVVTPVAYKSLEAHACACSGEPSCACDDVRDQTLCGLCAR